MRSAHMATQVHQALLAIITIIPQDIELWPAVTLTIYLVGLKYKILTLQK
jgi:hypothetical protein